jgi:diguanylate cyclase (GGDEF)-like protein/PAS domain S-box-containing protein
MEKIPWNQIDFEGSSPLRNFVDTLNELKIKHFPGWLQIGGEFLQKMRLGTGLGLLVGVVMLISVMSVVIIVDVVKLFDDVYGKCMPARSAVFEANEKLIALHRAMKDVVLADNQNELDSVLQDVSMQYAGFNHYIQKAAQYDTAHDDLIHLIQKSFDDWTPIREQVIAHIKAGEKGQAAEITKTTGRNQVALIDGYMNALIVRTQKEVDEKHTAAINKGVMAIMGLIVLAGLAILIAGFISFFVKKARKKYEQELRDEKEYFRVALHSIGDGLIITDAESKVAMLNPVAEKLTGWTQKEASGKPFLQVFNVAHEDPSLSIKNPVEEVLTTDTICELSNHAVLTSLEGVKRHVADSAAPVKDIHGKTTGVIMVFRDVTEKKKYVEEIKSLSIHDSLTGLYNRLYFETQIQRMKKTRQYPITIIVGDINGLKLTNDVFGHSWGDTLIKIIGEILSKCCRAEDICARWGGDEFIIGLPKTTAQAAEQISQRIIDLCKKHIINVDGISINPSISIGNATLQRNDDIDSVVKLAETNMYRAKLLESKSIHSSIINSMQEALAEKSLETKEHAERLVAYCSQMSTELNLPASEQNELELLALVHDIGKIIIDKQILLKPDKLSLDEWRELKRHPEYGYRIAKSAPELTRIAEYILTHHERWDGKGYPQGLSGDNIPLLSRILAVVDSFDAMTSDRPYRKAMTIDAAKQELIHNAGTQFDPEIVKIMLKIMETRLIDVSESA